MPDFDVDALYAALDEQRRSRGLTWAQLTREINGQFARVPVGLISASTITGMRTRRVIEGDGVLQMLRWLGRAPEAFVPGTEPWTAANAALPVVAQGQILRFDTPAIYAALDAQRTGRGMTWTQVARDIGGCSAASLTRLAGGGRTAFPDIVRIAGWLGRPVASFTRVARQP
jgi:hypothetical protein